MTSLGQIIVPSHTFRGADAMGGDADGSILRAEVRRILGEQTPEEQLADVLFGEEKIPTRFSHWFGCIYIYTYLHVHVNIIIYLMLHLFICLF